MAKAAIQREIASKAKNLQLLLLHHGEPLPDDIDFKACENVLIKLASIASSTLKRAHSTTPPDQLLPLSPEKSQKRQRSNASLPG